MKICRSITDLHQQLKPQAKRVIVPTMGALHQGHGSLIRKAKSVAGEQGQVIVSIFVNPTQFDRVEDLDTYPDTFDADKLLCKQLGADIIFYPSASEMYYEDRSISLSEVSLSKNLCGATRPGHFDGVCLVVNKLFNITKATHGVFGEKDFQQLAIIKRMVRDLSMPIEIIGGDTVRETSGLAMSSRNLNLTGQHKELAPEVYKTLQAARSSAQAGETSSRKLIEMTTNTLTHLPNKPTIDYLNIVDEDTLAFLDSTEQGHPVMAIAIFFGEVRLIDHIHLS